MNHVYRMVNILATDCNVPAVQGGHSKFLNGFLAAMVRESIHQHRIATLSDELMKSVGARS